ncbi:MAG: hypothetical protein R2781_03415 [Flavobacteriaceae bacterium]
MSNPAGKTTAIVTYCTFIGFFIALSMNQEKKDTFAIWHLKNMFGLLIILFVAITLQYYTVIGFYIHAIAAMFWLLSISMAIAGKQQGVPFLSEKFQQWFTFLG